jgi:hypothetical protein
MLMKLTPIVKMRTKYEIEFEISALKRADIFHLRFAVCLIETKQAP